MQNGSAYGCNFIFYDSGGANELYTNNEHLLYTFMADIGQYPHLHFNFFNVVLGDTLFIYDGTDVTGRLIGRFTDANITEADYANHAWGQAPPADLYATSGSFTFRFKSDGSGTGNGWGAAISCVPALNILPCEQEARLGLSILYSGVKSEVFTVDSGTQITLDSEFILPSMLTNDYVVQSIPYNPPFELWEGASLGMGVDDKWGPPTTLPFTFSFFGKPYTIACPGSNGAVSFNYHANSSWFPYSYAHTNNIADNGPTPANSIYGVLEDIDPRYYYPVTDGFPSGNIRYGVLGEYPNRAFVFNFWRVKLYGLSSNVLNNYNSYQIVLFEATGVIEVHVRHRKCCATTNQNGEGIIGIRNNTGTQFLVPQEPFRGMQNPSWEVLGETNDSLREAWRFWPVAPPVICEEMWFQNDTASEPLFTGKSNILRIEESMKLIARLQFTAPSGEFYTLLDTLTVKLSEDTINNTDAITPISINELKVYPNPTNELLNIEFGSQFQYIDGLQVQITDLSGKILYNADIFNANTKIDVKNYPSGIYVVNVKNRKQETLQSCRVVKY
jgi:hypothetical protein